VKAVIAKKQMRTGTRIPAAAVCAAAASSPSHLFQKAYIEHGPLRRLALNENLLISGYRDGRQFPAKGPVGGRGSAGNLPASRYSGIRQWKRTAPGAWKSAEC